ncbi:MAG: methylthioribose-phosphate isomerase, partial [Actinomycetota bacterium]|nr:methylthioribose-phosphate isomerase [Actinomycetota bacterium]
MLPVPERQNAGVAAEDPIPRTVEWRDGAVRLIDQRDLPGRLRFLDCRTVDEVCEAISSLAVRGAPALGAAGGYGVALACALAGVGRGARPAAVVRAATEAADRLIATRPTAVNLAWGAHRVLAAAQAAAEATVGAGAGESAAGSRLVDGGRAEAVARAALQEAERLAEQDV